MGDARYAPSLLHAIYYYLSVCFVFFLSKTEIESDEINATLHRLGYTQGLPVLLHITCVGPRPVGRR